MLHKTSPRYVHTTLIIYSRPNNVPYGYLTKNQELCSTTEGNEIGYHPNMS